MYESDRFISDEDGNLSTEASDLGLAVGEWPDFIEVTWHEFGHIVFIKKSVTCERALYVHYGQAPKQQVAPIDRWLYVYND